MDVNIKVPALEKLLDYAASGIGSVAGPMLAPWKAGRDGRAQLVAAQGEVEAQKILAEGRAVTMQIIAAAQADARSALVSPEAILQGEITISDLVNQRIQFQEEMRQANIGSVVRNAALELGDGEVQGHEVDHDWTGDSSTMSKMCPPKKCRSYGVRFSQARWNDLEARLSRLLES